MQREINWFEAALYTYFGLAAPLMLIGVIFKINLLFLIGGGLISLAMVVGVILLFVIYSVLVFRKIRKIIKR